ncbi:SET domain-containing protein [Ophiobolus disseminans]|uniref:SET domain-containing protein n=1 Tax=Ophiobolus disseminans TaxID=1469910 RepID=A0A6A6ZPA9_9PLEO|nr:SET domain-containing protein [Ophiobolus disseminans]
MADLESPPSVSPSVYNAPSISRPSSCSSAPPDETPNKLPASAPKSFLFEVRHTPTAGRAVFATQDIAEATLIFRSDDLTLSVLLREYRREVCGQCFSYDYGRDLGFRDKNAGFVFCSETCHGEWMRENGDIGVQAWSAVETFVKKRSKEDSEMVDVDLPRPKSKDITKAWDGVAAQAEHIRIARANEAGQGAIQATKQHHKALQKALQAPISPDVMSFCVSGLLWHHNNPSDWNKVLALAADSTPYHNIDDLHAFIRTYLHLLAILPIPLLPFVTAESIFLLSSRDSHNSFGIRSLEDEGSEFFGYGCWPAASYFNHSCAPNIEKRRGGRAWEFRTGKNVKKGEELNITYLSGEERKLTRGKRMQTLKRNWGFDCGCEQCEVEQ